MFALAWLFLFGTPTTSVGSERLVLHHATIVDASLEPPVQADMTVVVEQGHIRSVQPSREHDSKQSGRRIDLKGKYLLPGFVDMHVHALLSPMAEDGHILPRPPSEATKKLLQALLENGITTIRDPGAPTSEAVDLRARLRAGEVVGPNSYTAGSILNVRAPGPEFVQVRSDQEVVKEIDRQARAGVDFIKLYAGMNPELVRTAIVEAHRRRLRVIGHLQATSWTQAARMGIDFLAHAAPWSPDYLSGDARAGYDGSMFGRVYWLRHVDLKSDSVSAMCEELVKHRVSIDPTLIAMRTKFWGDDSAYLHSPFLSQVPEYAAGWPRGSYTASWTREQYEEARTQWPKLLQLVKLLYDRGVLLTVGTDTPSPWIVPGVSYAEELELLHEAGIPNLAVLRMASYNAALAMGKEREWGSIRPGLRADLVVLSDSPVEDLSYCRSVEAVIQGGTVYRFRSLKGR